MNPQQLRQHFDVQDRYQETVSLGEGGLGYGTETIRTLVCRTCGAVVADPDRHLFWHSTIPVTYPDPPSAQAALQGQDAPVGTVVAIQEGPVS